jgi:hypothetical protein
MKTTLPDAALDAARSRLSSVNALFAKSYPGEGPDRQPVHTVYGGAHLFRADLAPRLGESALREMQEYAAEPADLAEILSVPGVETPSEAVVQTIHARVLEKLRREPVEDFRIDFEDGYGNRPDAEEDGHAASVAEEVAKGLAAGSLPPFIGIRIKPFSEELRERSIRTLDLFLTSLLEFTEGRLPSNFVVTVPKVALPEHVSVLADLFDLFESRLSLPPQSLKLELMIEVPQAILSERGESNLPKLLAAARGRCTGAHFGTYDYTAGCNITAAHQSMTHPACDFARHMMQVAFAGTGVWMSDGATNIMPIPPHRASAGGSLSDEQRRENRSVVHRAWRLHYEHTRHSLRHAFYQGWDLHPAQFVPRYAAVYAFFLEGFVAASDRLRNFIEKAGQATLVGDVFDDAATGQGLLNYFLRALNCGAITEQEALGPGLTLEELRGRSFVRILKNRRKA